VVIRLQGDATGTAPADPDADGDPAAGFAVLPASVPCPASYAEVVGAAGQNAWHWQRGDPASEPFDVSQAVTFEQAGAYTLCGYFGLEGERDLESDAAATTGAYVPVAITVARPTVSADLAIDGPLRPGANRTLSGRLSSNAPANVEVYLNRDSQACAANGPAGEPLDQFATTPGPFNVFGQDLAVSSAVALPEEVGRFRLCAYASREDHEGDPDLVRDLGPVEIGRPSVGIDLRLGGVLRPSQTASITGRLTTDAPVNLDVDLNDAGTPCRESATSNAPYDQLTDAAESVGLAGGALDVRLPIGLPARPGDFHLCAYASRDGSSTDPDAVADLGPVTVGRPVATVAARIEGFLVPGGFVRLIGSATADAPLTVAFQLNHRDDACAATAQGNLGRNRFTTTPDPVAIGGTAPRTLKIAAQLPELAGTYHLCGYAVRDGADADPDLVVDSARAPGGTYLVQPQSRAIGQVIYANGTHGTVRVRCSVPKRRLPRGRRIRMVCAHATGAVSVSYRRISPSASRSTLRRLKVGARGVVSLSTKGMRPGLYRVRVTWKGWLLRRSTVRVSDSR
jgi:hypothetical protein